MNLDLPITAFALESSGAAAQALSAPRTLTLKMPVAAQSRPSYELPFGGSLSLECSLVLGGDVVRVSVSPNVAPVRTLTF